jgi:hypothetical protein
MEMSENNSVGSNPLFKHTMAATSTEAPLANEPNKSAPQTGGTGANTSLPTAGSLSQTASEATNLSDNADAPADAEPAGDVGPDDDVNDPGVNSSSDLPEDDEEGNQDNNIFDDDLDALDGPLLDENNPRH